MSGCGAIGIAVVGALLSVGFRGSLGTATEGLSPDAEELAGDSLGGLLQVAGGLDPVRAAPLVDAGRAAFTDGMQLGIFAAAALLGVTAVAVAALHPRAAPRWAADLEGAAAAAGTGAGR